MLTHMARMLTRMTRWLAGSHIIHTRVLPHPKLLQVLLLGSHNGENDMAEKPRKMSKNCAKNTG